MSVIKYYSTEVWLDLDHYPNLKMKCNEDNTMMQKFVEKERILKFLVGLNVKYDQVWVQGLKKEFLPLLSEVSSRIRAEEGRRTMMLDNHSIEGSTLVISSPNNNNISLIAESGKAEKPRPSTNKDGLWCNHCKKLRYMKENCWKLHGKNQSFGQNNAQTGQHGGQAYVAQSDEVSYEKNMLDNY